MRENIWDFSESRSGVHTVNGTILQSLFDLNDSNFEPVSVTQGLKISTVYICVNVRGKTISSLPGNVFREDGNKKENISDHPTYYVLSQQPNKYMSAPNFWLTLMLHHDAWGNGFARINRDSRMRPASLDILEPWEVSITKDDGDVWYHYKGDTINARDILHLRSYSFDGVCGRSPILENQETMGMAKKFDKFAALTLGSRPPGVLSYDGNLTPEQMAANKQSWNDQGTGVKVLGGAWKFHPIMNEADASQFIQAKASNKREIWGIYQIPPTFAQDYERATFSNAEQSDLVYTKHTITPIVTMIEKEVNMKMFYEREKVNHYWKFNLNGLLRGDFASRQAFYQAMVNTGIMNRNEARGYEDMNPYDGGDVPLIQGAMIPGDEKGIDALRSKMETEVIPTAKPVNGKEKHLNGHGILN